MKEYKIFTVNPGSTSTKIGLFEGDKAVVVETINHDSDVLNQFASISDQLPYRRDMIYKWAEENNIVFEDVDAFVGRCGSVNTVEGGVYEITELLNEHARVAINGVHHPAQLGSQLALEFAKKYGKPGYVMNPPETDELCDLARMTGIKGVYRSVHMHALNLKETAIRHCKLNGLDYESVNLIVCHLGGGISVSAHQNGRMIDGNDIPGGEGPLAPTRCGSIPVTDILTYMKDKSIADVKPLLTKTGGFVSLLGTSDAKKVYESAVNGDKAADRAWNAMIYQINKAIGSMAAVLSGKVDGILLGGGLVHNQDLVDKIKASCKFIAPVYPYPGEFELEAMAAGAIRVLSGEEKLKEYTGVPIWNGFED